jgi:hypothetical protein
MAGDGLQRRMVALSARHAELEAEIQEEMKRPRPDTVRVQALKKQKLRIKEELVAIRSGALQPA